MNNDSFVEGPIEKLNDREDPAFYDLNKRELESIDLERVSKAVKTACRVPNRRSTAVTSPASCIAAARRRTGWTSRPDVCEALVVWSETPGPAGDAALKVAKDLVARERTVPPEMIVVDREGEKSRGDSDP